MELEQIKVIHNPAENRFETTLDGKLSKLDYIQNGKNFVITHVGVHPSYAGRELPGRSSKWDWNTHG